MNFEETLNKKHNIIILNHHATAPDTGGGGRHYEIAKFFSSIGHDVTVLASSYDNGKKVYKVDEELSEKNFNENFLFVRFKTKPAYKNTIGRFLNYIDYKNKVENYTNFKGRPDVIIASSVHPLAWVAGYKLSKKYNAKFIVEVRDLWPLSMYEDFSGITKKIVFSYFESLEKKYYSLADAIITTAPFAYEYMNEKYGIDKSKVHYIPHGIDIDSYDEQSNYNDSVLPPNLNEALDNKFCITYTGALSKSEGLPTLIESAKYLERHSDIQLVIVGSGSEKEVLDNIIKKYQLNNVLMIDKQPREYIPLILKKSKLLFCGLMEREAFKYGISKNKFYDYMASGKPVIFASNVRGSLISKANAGYTIEPNNPEKLYETIMHIYNNETLSREFGENGRNYVINNHTLEIISNSFLRVMSKSNNH